MRALLMLVVLIMVCSACGIKGPLYLPEKRYPQPTTSDKPVNTETKSQ